MWMYTYIIMHYILIYVCILHFFYTWWIIYTQKRQLLWKQQWGYRIVGHHSVGFPWRTYDIHITPPSLFNITELSYFFVSKIIKRENDKFFISLSFFFRLSVDNEIFNYWKSNFTQFSKKELKNFADVSTRCFPVGCKNFIKTTLTGEQIM